MRRRNKTGGKAVKTQRRKTLSRQRSPASRRRNSRVAGKETIVARLSRERDESLQQLAAASEILKVINSSAGDLKPIFAVMLENATRICEASFGSMLLREGNRFRRVAVHNAPTGFAKFTGENPVVDPTISIAVTRIWTTKRIVHIADLLVDDPNDPLAKYAGARTLLLVPLVKDNELVGTFGIYRQEVRSFTSRQIELVATFAAQAVIAIENTRLLNELRQRTGDLSEALERQTATSEVLEIISSSPGELGPVFETMLANAVRICEAKFGTMIRAEEGGYRTVAMHGAPPAYANERRRNPLLQIGPTNPLLRLAASKQLQHIADIRADQAFRDRDRAFVQLAEGAGARTLLLVPMLKENELIGAIAIYRQEVCPFSDKQIALVQNFAAQAVIAIENTRLLSELRESLQQQTATADVLKVISSSPATLDPVFSTMLAKATELCGASYSTLWLLEGDGFRTAAIHGDLPPAWIEQWRSGAIYRPGQGVLLARVTEERQPIQVADMRTDPSYLQGDPLPVAGVEIAGIRTLLVVPMFKERQPVGAIAIYRKEVLPFTEKQIELVQNFAAQAVIAIENTRLLSELRESLQQQTATADVLKVISRSTFNLQVVLDTLVESAARLCGAEMANIWRPRDGAYRLTASYGVTARYKESLENKEFLNTIAIEPGRGTTVGRVLLERKSVHIHDIQADPDYKLSGLVALGGTRTMLGIPMLREGDPIGVLVLVQSAVRPFTDKQIELATTFADQAVIAIENVRLFEEVQARTRELAASLEELRTTQDRLVQTQKLALLGQLTAGIAHEIKNPLNFVNNFSGISAELIGELQDTLKVMPLDDKARTEINELTDTLKSNFDKVVHHGRRADAIVKNMLQHSREGSGEHRVIDINALVEESLNLAWHGARAETQGFEIKLKQSFDPFAGEADVFPQDIRRALLNVISNGYYAAIKRGAEINGDDYEPTLTASTKNLGDRVEVRIRDNGTGMTSDVKEKMFNPFFTTKPTGEGTGLGLSISHDIIVKQHAGSIEVDTQLGEFTEIRIILPRTAAFV